MTANGRSIDSAYCLQERCNQNMKRKQALRATRKTSICLEHLGYSAPRNTTAGSRYPHISGRLLSQGQSHDVLVYPNKRAELITPFGANCN